jgi:hypothetical protein
MLYDFKKRTILFLKICNMPNISANFRENYRKKCIKSNNVQSKKSVNKEPKFCSRSSGFLREILRKEIK